MFGELKIGDVFNTLVGRYKKTKVDEAECIICPAFPECVGKTIKFNSDFKVVPLCTH